jgi:hypothetical protein
LPASDIGPKARQQHLRRYLFWDVGCGPLRTKIVARTREQRKWKVQLLLFPKLRRDSGYPDLGNSVGKAGLILRVGMNHSETRSPLAPKILYRVASARRILGLLSYRHLVLTTGFALLLCVILGGCSGFFIKPSISSIYISPPSSTIAVNNTVQLTATAIYSDGSQNTISGSSVGWSSSDDTIATVTSPGGSVTGVATGTATITVASQGVTATGTVTVTPTNVTTISITTTQGNPSPQSTATIAGAPATLQFYAYANMQSSQDLTQAVTWSSSNTNVATISTGLGSGGNGLATSVTAGTTNITATIRNTSSGTLVTSNTIVLTVQ